MAREWGRFGGHLASANCVLSLPEIREKFRDYRGANGCVKPRSTANALETNALPSIGEKFTAPWTYGRVKLPHAKGRTRQNQTGIRIKKTNRRRSSASISPSRRNVLQFSQDVREDAISMLFRSTKPSAPNCATTSSRYLGTSWPYSAGKSPHFGNPYVAGMAQMKAPCGKYGIFELKCDAQKWDFGFSGYVEKCACRMCTGRMSISKKQCGKSRGVSEQLLEAVVGARRVLSIFWPCSATRTSQAE